MTRPLRLEHHDAFWHIHQRGNERRDIFLDDADRIKFLTLLGVTCEKYRWRLLTYVLMTNHYHLVIQTPDLTLSSGMHWLDQTYAQFFNRRHERVGHLFQGRFTSHLIQKGPHLNEVLRYVVLNPVRAAMVDDPADYRWSAHRSLMGRAPSPDFLDDSWVLALDPDPVTARGIYTSHVAERIANPRSVWDELQGQIYLGSAEWVDDIRPIIEEEERSREHPRTQRLPITTSIESVATAVGTVLLRSKPGSMQSRDMFHLATALICRDRALRRAGEVASALGYRSPSSAARIAKKAARRFEEDEQFRQIVQQAIEQLRK
jgi:putative transposase